MRRFKSALFKGVVFAGLSIGLSSYSIGAIAAASETPALENADKTNGITEIYNAVYDYSEGVNLNGNSAIIMDSADSDNKYDIYVDADMDGVLDESEKASKVTVATYTNIYGVYGEKATSDIKITILGTKSSGTVYGGHHGEVKNVTIDIKGSYGTVYGISNSTKAIGNITINASRTNDDTQPYIGSIYAAYGGCEISGSVNETIENVTVGTLYGTNSVCVEKNVNILVKGADARVGNLYGNYARYNDYSIGGNFDIKVTGGIVSNLYGTQYGTLIKGNATIAVDGSNASDNNDNYGYWYNIYGLQDSVIEGDCKVDITGVPASGYIYGISNCGEIDGKTDITISDITMKSSSSYYGINNSNTLGPATVTMNNLKLYEGYSSLNSVYGVYGSNIQAGVTVAMDNILCASQIYGVYQSGVTGGANINITNSNAYNTNYNGEKSPTTYIYGAYYGQNDVLNVTIKDCDTYTTAPTYYPNNLESSEILVENVKTSNGFNIYYNSGTAKTADINIKSCDLKGVQNFSLCAEDTANIKFTASDIELSYGGTIVSNVNNTSGKTALKEEFVATNVTCSNSSQQTIGNDAYQCGSSTMIFDAESTIPEGIIIKPSGTSSCNGYAKLGNNYYLSGNHALDDISLKATDNLYLSYYDNEIEKNINVNSLYLNNCYLYIPKGLTVSGKLDYIYSSVVFVAGSFTSTLNEDYALSSAYSYVCIDGGTVSDEAFKNYTYYRVTPSYNKEQVAISVSDASSNYDTVRSIFKNEETRYYVKKGTKVKITCTVNEGYQLAGGTYQGKNDLVASGLVKSGNVLNFDMPESETVVTVASEGIPIQISKTKGDPVAKLNQTYTSKSPLYDFETLMLKNDSTEEDKSMQVSVKSGTLPTGITLDGTTLVGRPTVSNDEGTKVTFTVTGKNQTSADIILNIIVTDKSGVKQPEQTDRVVIDETSRIIDLKGNAVVIDKDEDGKTVFFYDDDMDGVADDSTPFFATTDKYDIYGVKDTRFNGKIKITMNDGDIRILYGASNATITSTADDAVYVEINGGTAAGYIYGQVAGTISGGVVVYNKAPGINYCYGTYSGTSKSSMLNNKGAVSVVGNYVVNENIDATSFGVPSGSYSKRTIIKVPEGKTIKANTYSLNYAEIHCKGNFGCNTSISGNSYTRIYVYDSGKVLDTEATLSYVYVPVSFTLDRSAVKETISITEPSYSGIQILDDPDTEEVEELQYGQVNGTYVYCTSVTGFGIKYAVNDMEPVETANSYPTVKLDKKSSAVRLSYYPLQITATTQFADPIVYAKTTYDETDPVYDYTSIAIANDASVSYGSVTYEIKKGSSLPAGLSLVDGKVIGKATAKEDTTADVTVVITGRNGTKTEVTLTYQIDVNGEYVNIDRVLSYDSGVLNLNGYPVVIKAGTSNSSRASVYLDLDRDGVADSVKAFTVNESTEFNISKIVGYNDTENAYDGDIFFTVEGGNYQYVYGAEGTADNQVVVNGSITVNVTGGSVSTMLAGGYYASADSINVNITGGTFYYNLVGAYQPESVDYVNFKMIGTAKYRNSSYTESYYMAIVDGGTVNNDVRAILGSSGNIFYSSSSSSYRERFYGINGATVKGNVNYEIVNTVQTGTYPNRFANGATINGDINVDWKAGNLGVYSSSTNYGTFSYESNVKNINVTAAENGSAGGTIYPIYKGTVENVTMTVPSTCTGYIYTALKHPSEDEASATLPTKNGYIDNKGNVYVSGEHTISENKTLSSLRVEKDSKLVIAEGVVITSPATTYNYGTIENNGTYNQQYGFNNYGTFDNKGTFSSSSTVTIYADGTIKNTGAFTSTYTVDIQGTFINDGTLNFAPSRSNSSYKFNISSTGKLENKGSFTASGSYMYNYGTLDNSGELEAKYTVYNYKDFINSNTATFTSTLYLYQNSKTINSGELNTNYLQTQQKDVSIKNESDGVWTTTAYVYSIYDNTSIVNDGTWTTNGTVTLYYEGSSVVNNGQWNMNVGIYLNQATFTNNGTFTGVYNGTGSGYCVYDYNGKIYNEGTWEGSALVSIQNGYFENSGTLTLEPISEGSYTTIMSIYRTTADTNTNLNGLFYNKPGAAMNINAKVDNGSGVIVNEGALRLNYANKSYPAMFGKIYFAKNMTFADTIDVATLQKKWKCFYPVKAEYLDTIFTDVDFVDAVKSPVEDDENLYCQAGNEFNVRVTGFVDDCGYDSDDIKTVKYGSDENVASRANVENQFKGTMPYEATTVSFEIEKNKTSKISIDPETVEIESLKVDTKVAKIYDLNNLEITGDDDIEGAKVNFAVSQSAPLPEGLTLTNGVIGGTPTKASATPITTTIIVTGKNKTTAKFNITFNVIEKAIPIFTVPTGIYGSTDYTLSQCYGVPMPTTGVFSWPDATLVITDKCIAGEKFDIYFTPNDTDNYDWTSFDESVGVWNAEEGRLECKVSIRMNTITPSWIGTYYPAYPDYNDNTKVVQAEYGQKLSEVEIPSDGKGTFTWNSPNNLVGDAGTRTWTYATYTPNDTARYSTLTSVRVYYYVNKKAFTLTAPTELISLKGNTIAEVVLPSRDDGTYEWKSATSIVVEDNTTYELIFKPKDTKNYVYSTTDGVYNSSYGGYVFNVTIRLVDHTEEQHVWEEKHDATYHWKECSCAEVREKEKHSDKLDSYIYSKVDGSKDKHHITCTCGYEFDEDHEFVITAGVDTHWYECKCGEFKNEVNHIYNRTEYDETGHWRCCAICNATTEKVLHTYTKATYNSSQHWNYCSCGAKEPESIKEHVYDKLVKDGIYHWYECSCGSSQTPIKHVFSDWENDPDNNKHKRSCVCGWEESSNHLYFCAPTSSKDQDTHTYKCEYCKVSYEEEHIFDAGVVVKPPTDTTNGQKDYTCVKCKLVRREVLPSEQSKHSRKLNNIKYDENEHWIVCDDGDEYEFVGTRKEHSFEAKTSSDKHWLECSECHYKKDEGSHSFERGYNADEHYFICSCGTKKSIESHRMTNASDEVNHWMACSCGYKESAVKHSYDNMNYDTKQHWYECSCGKKKYISNHEITSWEEDSLNNKHIGTCDCGYKETKDHNFDSYEKLDETSHKEICDVCFAERTVAHSFDDGKVTKNPTVAEEGIKTYTCTICGETKEEAVPRVDCEHSTYSETYSSDDNQHWRVCTICNSATTDLADHEFGEPEVIKAATETEEGTVMYCCAICKYEKTVTVAPIVHVHKYDILDHDEEAHWYHCACSEDEIARKAPHSYGEAIVITPATTEAEGLVEYTCTACGEKKQEAIPKLEAAHTHSYSGWVADKENGNHFKQCACGEKIVEDHAYSEEWVRVDASNHAKICEACNDRILEIHHWGEGVPTATPGKTLYTCIDCAAQKYETEAEVGHTHEYGDWISEDENVHKKICKDDNCSVEIYEKHTFDKGVITTAPTYKEDGVKTYTCTKCGETKEETVEKMPCPGHAYELTNTVKPTCVDVGYKEYTCKLCGYVDVRETPATGIHSVGGYDYDENSHWRVCAGCEITFTDTMATHSFVFVEITKEATETEEGIELYECSVCKATKEKTIPVKKPVQPVKPKPAKVGTKLTDSKTGYKYIVVDPKKIDSADKSTTPAVAFYGSTKKLSGTASIPAAVTIKQINYRVIAISNDALKNQTSLTKITIAKTIKKVGTNAFYGCKKLATVTFAKGTVVKDIGNGAFSGCVKLKEMKLPTTVKTLGSKAFNGCTALTTVSIGKNVAKIGSNCFYNCKAITKLTIATTKLTAKNVGKAAFKNVGTKSISKLTVKVPKSKLKAYKSLLVKKGLSKKAKVTK